MVRWCDVSVVDTWEGEEMPKDWLTTFTITMTWSSRLTCKKLLFASARAKRYGYLELREGGKKWMMMILKIVWKWKVMKH